MTEWNTLTVGQIPHLHAQLHTRRGKVAVVEGTERLTWAQLSDRTARLANGLARLGVGRGDKVVALLTNRAQYPELVYAVAGLGAVIVPLSYRFVAAEVEHAVRHSDASVAVVDAELLDTFMAARLALSEQVPPERVVVLGPAERAPAGYVNYDTLLETSPTSTDYLDQREGDTYHLAFTGGTTGPPKACEIPHRLARQLWYDIAVEVGVREDDTTLIAGPFYHGMGFTWGLQQLMVGGTIVLQRTFDPRGALDLIRSERVTFTPMAPTMYTMLLEVKDKEAFDVTSMRGLVSAAAPLLSATKEALLAYFTSAGLFECYGSTESGFFSVLKPRDQLRKTRSVGLAWLGREIRVLDPEGRQVAPDEVGEIFVRGPRLGTGYYKNPQATLTTFGGEWLSSGDLGTLDDEGYLYVVDRVDDMIISGGVNVFPTEIEEVLSRHPDVVEVAVVGVPDPRWGQTVHAYVVTRGSSVTVEELDALCRERLAGYKRPRHYHRVADLPKNASGKLLKRVLRQREGEMDAGKSG